jgi:hypothetical protein
MTAAVIELHLRGEWIAATRRETQRLLAENTSADDLGPCVDAFLETIASIERTWKRFLDMLGTTGLSMSFTNETIQAMRPVLGNARDLLRELHEHAPHRRTELESAGQTLTHIEKNLQAIESTPVPEIDPERLRKGMEEAVRGEGEDAEALLLRFAQTGSL